MKNYVVHHILIGLAVQSLLIQLTGNIYFATIIPSVFYIGREIWQFKYKRIGKKFDWDGCVPVTIAVILVMLGGL